MSRKTAGAHTALERNKKTHKQPWYSYHGSSMRDTGHSLHEHFTMGRTGEHEHFFDFESVDREWHKLRHTWDERKGERNKREDHEKEVFESKCDAIKPNKDNNNVTVKANRKQSKTSSIVSYDPSRFSGSPRRLRTFTRNTLVYYQDTVWKVIACNTYTGKHDLVHLHGVYAPRSRVDGVELQRVSPNEANELQKESLGL
jgi:hypothetical protein